MDDINVSLSKREEKYIDNVYRKTDKLVLECIKRYNDGHRAYLRTVNPHADGEIETRFVRGVERKEGIDLFYEYIWPVRFSSLLENVGGKDEWIHKDSHVRGSFRNYFQNLSVIKDGQPLKDLILAYINLNSNICDSKFAEYLPDEDEEFLEGKRFQYAMLRHGETKVRKNSGSIYIWPIIMKRFSKL